MTAPYLLSLADLHAAAPGILDVVFGPDGDFEGAPLWTPAGWEMHPMLVNPDHRCRTATDVPHLWLPGHGWAFRTFSELALDLRQPTVAARLAGLCARALGEVGTGWRVQRTGTWDLTDGVVSCCWRSDGTSWADMPQWPAVAGGPWTSNVAFLRALTLTLAPRIAALRTT